MKRVGVTGADGFLGWHLRVLAATRGDVDLRLLDRRVCADEGTLAQAVDGLDRVVHLAGVNRGDADQVREGNLSPAEILARAVGACERAPELSFANSTQSGNGTVYGTAKERAAETLRGAAAQAGVGFVDVRLPNLFGEHGRPHYNSVVATFCHELAHGGRPRVDQDRPVHLLHARGGAAALLDTACGDGASAPSGFTVTVSELLETLAGHAETYGRAEIPSLPDGASVDLFNTLRSFYSPVRSPASLPRHADQRGALVEAVKVHGSTGQCFFSSSLPGVTRGQHYHLRKVERFVVVQGEAVISLRRMLHPGVVAHHVSGDDPVAVDMPTMWVHNIRNVGSGPLLTLFWANDLFDPLAPDTYPQDV